MAREIYIWSKTRHENVQELLGIVTFEGQIGMVSDWMPNGNLQQYIQKNPSVERYPLVCVDHFAWPPMDIIRIHSAYK